MSQKPPTGGWLKDAEIEVVPKPGEASPSEMSELIRLMTLEQAEKIREREEDRKRKELSKRNLQEALKQADEQREAAMRACTHKKPDGSWATGGQPNNDGKVTLLCLRCPRIWRITPSPANLEAIRRGDLSLSGIEPPQDVPLTADAVVA